MPKYQSSLSSGIDFFDIDHTVVDGSTSFHFLVMGVQLGQFSAHTLLSVPVFLWQYYFGRMDIQMIQKSVHGFKGYKKEELAKISVINFERNIKNRIFPECEQLIRTLKEKGRRIAFVTSSFTHVVQPLAEYLHVDFLITNSLKYEDNITNGDFNLPFIFGNEKNKRSLELLEKLGVPPSDCSFYTDSINDISLLQTVGKPVAVNPDWRLKKIAHKNNWEILTFRK